MILNQAQSADKMTEWLFSMLSDKKVNALVSEEGRWGYEQNKVIGLKWILTPKRVLRFQVLDEKIFSVDFQQGDKFVFRQVDCSCCFATPVVLCVHKACCLWALSDLLILKSESAPYKKAVTSFWGAGAIGQNPILEKPLPFKLNLKIGPSYWQAKNISVDFYHGSEQLSALDHRIPPILRVQYGAKVEKALLPFLKAGGQAEITLRTDRGDKKAEWDPTFQVKGRIRIECLEKKWKWTRLAETRDGKKIASFFMIGEIFIFEPKSGRLGILLPSPSWDFLDQKMSFAELSKYFNHSGFKSDSEPVIFLKQNLDQEKQAFLFEGELAEKFEKHFEISDESEKICTRRAEAGYQLSLLPFDRQQGHIKIVPEMTLDGNPIRIQTRGLFRFLSLTWITHGENGDRHSRGNLRVTDIQSVVSHLVEIALSQDPTEQKKIAQKCWNAFPYRKAYRRNNVRSLLKQMLVRYQEFLASEKVIQMNEQNGQITLLEINPRKLNLLAGLCAKAFKFSTKQVIHGEEDTISKKKFFTGLRDLKKLYDDAGIPIFFDRKAIQAPAVNVWIQAGRPSGQNWFEVHPEIKVGNENIPVSEIMAATFQNGFFQTTSTIQLLDEKSLALLERVAQFLKMRNVGRNSKENNLGFDSEKEWVHVKPLEILDWAAMREWGVKLDLPPEDEALLQKLMRFKKVKMPPLPDHFVGELRHYQEEGYAWLAFLYEHRLGACLADDMGLGKTVQAITFLGALYEGKVKSRPEAAGKPHLIVMPSSLLFNWESELQRFYPNMKIFPHVGAESQLPQEGFDIILTTYDLLRRNIEVFKTYSFHTAWFDEAQTIKNIFAARTQAARSIQACFKVCLSGTPLENHIGEYYSVMDLCVPGLLGNYELFRNQVSKDELGLLTKRTRPFVLRRTKEKVLLDLPDKTEMDVYLPMEDEQKLIYVKAAGEIKQKIEEAFATKASGQARIIALTGLLRLRQICVTPELIQPKWKTRSPKTAHLVEKLHELKEEGHSALVFSQFTSYLDCLEKSFEDEKFSFLRLDGSTPLLERKKRVESFQSSEEPKIFLISLKAGGFGLNLTRANYVFHMDPWWNPAVDRQASDRVHRIGQDKKVFITRLLMKHSIEEKVMAMRQSKWELFQTVMQEGGALQSGLGLNKADFDFLLSP